MRPFNSRVLIHHIPTPSPSPGGDTLLDVATTNNATHLWQATNYLTTGWVDDIASLTLTNQGANDAAAVQVSGVDTVEFNTAQQAYVGVSLTYTEPFEFLFLGRLRDTVGSQEIILGCDTGVDGFIQRSASSIWQIKGSITKSAGDAISADTNWHVFYARFGGDATTQLKVGVNAFIEDAGTFTPNAVVFGARGSGARISDFSLVNAAVNTDGDWTNSEINNIANKMVSDASALSPSWSDLT